MDFNTKELQQAIGKLKGLINTKSPYVVTKGILYENGLFTATDMNVHASVAVSVGLIPTAEKFIIPVHAFDAINKLSATNTTITAGDKNTITVQSGKFNTRFTSYNADEFPHFDGIADEIVKVPVDFAQFTAALNGVVYAVSIDEKKGALCGTNISSLGAGITFTALDGFRAARTNVGFDSIAQFGATVPSGFWKALGKISSGEDKAVFSVSANGKTVAVKGEEFEVISRTLEGTFPDVSRIINGLNTDKTVIVDKDDILHALDLHSATLKDNGANNLIVLHINQNDNAVQFTARSENSNFSFEIGAECDGFGDEFVIGFNSKYLAEAIKAMSNCTEVRISVRASTTGALVQNNDYPDSGEALVLPVRINA